MFARKTLKCIDIHPSSFVQGNLSRNGAAGAELPGGGVQLVHDTRLAAGPAPSEMSPFLPSLPKWDNAAPGDHPLELGLEAGVPGPPLW